MFTPTYQRSTDYYPKLSLVKGTRYFGQAVVMRPSECTHTCSSVYIWIYMYMCICVHHGVYVYNFMLWWTLLVCRCRLVGTSWWMKTLPWKGSWPVFLSPNSSPEKGLCLGLHSGERGLLQREETLNILGIIFHCVIHIHSQLPTYTPLHHMFSQQPTIGLLITCIPTSSKSSHQYIIIWASWLRCHDCQ